MHRVYIIIKELRLILLSLGRPIIGVYLDFLCHSRVSVETSSAVRLAFNSILIPAHIFFRKKRRIFKIQFLLAESEINGKLELLVK
jgi:hypothetical protein